MSNSELYVIELGGDIGDIATMHRLVRCKDCKYSYVHYDVRGRCLLCDLQLYNEVKPEDFCSRGETEEDYSDDTH